MGAQRLAVRNVLYDLELVGLKPRHQGRFVASLSKMVHFNFLLYFRISEKYFVQSYNFRSFSVNGIFSRTLLQQSLIQHNSCPIFSDIIFSL